MVFIEGVQQGVGIGFDRPSSEMRIMGGKRDIQEDFRALRTWSFSLTPWSDPAIVSMLRNIASGAIGEVRLYTRDAAVTNLLPDVLTDPTLPDAVWPVWPNSPSALLPYRGGIVAPARVYTFPFDNGDAGVTIPILPGVEYTLSVTGSPALLTPPGTDPTAPLLEYQVSIQGESPLTGSLAAPDADGGTWSTTFATPEGAHAFSIWHSTGGRGRYVSGPRLVQGPSDGFMEPGQGVPFVKIRDPQMVLRSTAGGRVRADFQVELVEERVN